jgi:pseudouridine-5'-phosphate glycosidase
VHWSAPSAEYVAEVLQAQDALATAGYGLVLANPIPPADELSHDLHERVLSAGLEAADRGGIAGKDVTPFLLDFFHRETRGESLRANVALVRANARLAAEVAVAYSA